MQIGFIGLGDMGQVLVPRLLDAGHQVIGWNRTRSKADPLIERGMEWADTPRAVAARSDVVFSVVTDGVAMRAVALGEDGVFAGLPADAVYLDMSTIDPEVSRDVAAEFAEAGLIMLDAPLSGSPITVANGTA